MQKVGFEEALQSVLQRDTRYHRDAYVFVRDALDFTVKLRKKNKEEPVRHVGAAELLDGLRQFAIKEFGPMVPTVFAYWHVQTCEDFGEMVFNLIRAGVFGKTPADSIDDFKNGFSFHETFVEPFLPDKRPVAVRQAPANKVQ